MGISLTPILTHFWSLFVVANVIALLWSVYLFASGRRAPGYTGEHDSNLPGWLANQEPLMDQLIPFVGSVS